MKDRPSPQPQLQRAACCGGAKMSIRVHRRAMLQRACRQDLIETANILWWNIPQGHILFQPAHHG
jgi:hypothetical protein